MQEEDLKKDFSHIGLHYRLDDGHFYYFARTLNSVPFGGV